ncbi:polysaccharide pyruvyl transferase family protein [Novosphingobium soli]|uniref:Polysaccharide pyruvyl transferase family protein n=1 Tax=Novosphingobium soli TaxID=574956 RepID=A0ABV6CXZ5_9SPHN
MTGAAAMCAAPGGRRQVFVCGDLHNLGDLKLLLQNLALTGGRGGIVRYWAALPAPVVRQVEAAGGVLVPGRPLLGFARHALGAEIVLGGGQLVRDNVAIRALLGLALAVLCARAGGGRLVTRGLGVSAVRSPLRRLLWRLVLRAAGTLNLRDELSARHLAGLLPGRRGAVHADMAFLPLEGAPAPVPGPGARRWIVVAPCVDAGECRGLDGAALDAAVAAALALCPGAGLVIACHDPHRDRAAATALAARWQAHAPRIADGYDLGALCGLYGEAALVVTNRLHALVFALLADAPALAIEDGSAKLRALAERFGVPLLPQAQEREPRAADCVAAALAFDRSHRARLRQEMAGAAAGNLR